jgi:hypothetical protein
MKLILGMAFAVFATSSAFAGDKNVNVINTPGVMVENTPGVTVENDSSSPVPVTIQNSSQTTVEWRYVGLTTLEKSGIWSSGSLVGIAAMNHECAKDFGSGARAASPAEALFRPNGDPDTRTGWLALGNRIEIIEEEIAAGTIYAAYDATTGHQLGEFDTTPRDALRLMACRFYSSNLNEDIAPAIRPNGDLVIAGCAPSNPPMPAACSAPVTIPVGP